MNAGNLKLEHCHAEALTNYETNRQMSCTVQQEHLQDDEKYVYY